MSKVWNEQRKKLTQIIFLATFFTNVQLECAIILSHIIQKPSAGLTGLDTQASSAHAAYIHYYTDYDMDLLY